MNFSDPLYKQESFCIKTKFFQNMNEILRKRALPCFLCFSFKDHLEKHMKLQVSEEICFKKKTSQGQSFILKFQIQKISNQSVEIKKNQMIEGMMQSQIISPQNANPQHAIGPRIRQHQLMTVYSSSNSSSLSRNSLLSQKPLSQRKSGSLFPQSLNSVDIGEFSLTHGPALSEKFIEKPINRSDKKQIRQNGTAQLKQIVKQQKIKLLVRNFIKKATQNNTFLDPVEYTPFFNPTQVKFWDHQGIQVNDYIAILMSVLSTFLIVALTLIYTLSIVFKQIDQSLLLFVLQPISLIFYFTQLGLNLFTVKIEDGKRIVTIKEIFWYCVRNTLTIDLISIIILVVDLFVHDQSINYVRLFIIIKLGIVLEKLEKLEILFIHNFYYEQYWSLLKVFIFNFSLAHFLAIFLIGMASINPNDNWMNYKDIILAPWPEKYAWAYYWATTIMLTVGFGDLAATNYEEAIVLTMIEMISCITLAYNINCVGTLISNIRQQDLEKGKNFKIFYKLSRKNDISEDLEWRINNYIEESSNIKKKFNCDEENLFIEKLPNGLKSEFLKQSHKKIFHNLPFFKQLMQRTLFNFAQKIQMHICHPEEIIQNIDQPHHLLILKAGQIGFTCKKNGCDFNNTVVDFIKVLGSQPVLLSLGFINKPRFIYEIKSIEYSIIFYMDFEKILSILKENETDYEIYCHMRDKSSIYLDEFQLFTCEICKGKHTKFTCPKLHYVPFKQQVATKYIRKFQIQKAKRDVLFPRFAAKQYCPMKIYKDQNWLEQRSPQQRFNETMKTGPLMHILSKRNHDEMIQKPQQSILLKEIADIKDFFSKNTAQLIKHEVSKAFHEDEAKDEIWLIETDRVRNYKTYFQADNSCNIRNKTNIMKRSQTLNNPLQKLAKLQEKINFYSNQNGGHSHDRSDYEYKSNMNSFMDMNTFKSRSFNKLMFDHVAESRNIVEW